MNQHRAQQVGSTLLLTRRALAALTSRHENVVRRHCTPVACKVVRSRTGSPIMLFDADECEQRLRAAERRFRTVA